jgi:hypothetical protein
MGKLKNKSHHQHSDDDAGDGLLQQMQAPAQNVLDPPVPAFLTLDVGPDLGIVRMDVLMTHGISSLGFIKFYFTGKAVKKKESFRGFTGILCKYLYFSFRNSEKRTKGLIPPPAVVKITVENGTKKLWFG